MVSYYDFATSDAQTIHFGVAIANVDMLVNDGSRYCGSRLAFNILLD